MFESILDEGIHIVGRSEDCSVCIPSSEVSRRHLRLSLSGDQCHFEDLESTSGTFHQGSIVHGVIHVSPPFHVKLGTAELSVVVDQGGAVASISAGHYEPGKEIAKGGMGAVLEADDKILHRTVAMKIIRPDIAVSESFRLRFIREAEVLARLEHPNIVPIYEMANDSDGRLFYTMKKVEGRNLQEVLESIREGDSPTISKFGLDALLTLFRKICDAISFAHSRGVIHRDLKPENIMVGAYGETLVMDWGLAKIIGDARQEDLEVASASGMDEIIEDAGASADLTLDGSVMGSPLYMSPEQAEGKVRELSEKTDIYALGGILYTILTLRPPIEKGTLKEVLLRVKSGAISSPAELARISEASEGSEKGGNSIFLILPLEVFPQRCPWLP